MSLTRIAGYPMDLSLKEGHSFPGEATKFPVEQGANFSDHIRELPDEIELECIVSASPIGEVATDPTRQGGVLAPVDALAKLREIKARCLPVAIETSLGVFPSMAFTDLDVPVDAQKCIATVDGKVIGALFFTAKFTKFNVVTNKRTRVAVKMAGAGAGGDGKGKAKAVAGKLIPVVRTIIWRHGNPPGSPWVPGNLIETVTSSYTPTQGQTHDEVVAFRHSEPGSFTISYTDQLGQPIIGDRRNALVADLRRNEDFAANADAIARLKGKTIIPFDQPTETVQQRAARIGKAVSTLPPGMSATRFQF